jgi:hypothetical protein
MSSLTKIFNPLRQAAAAFFKHDLALKRQPEGLHIVLEARPPEPRRKGKAASRADAAARQGKQELALVLEQLGALLAEYPESRGTLKHLVFVESAIRKKGLRALHKVPLDVLERALEQLEGLVTNWSPVGLANLRSKMAVAVLDREHANPEAEADAYRTAAVVDSEPLPPPAEHPGVGMPEVDTISDDAALAAAYAALGDAAPSGEVEFQGELGSRSSRALATPPPRASESAGDIQLRELQT